MLYRDPKEGPEAEEVKAPAEGEGAGEGTNEGAGDNAGE